MATNHNHNDLPRLKAWLAAAERDHVQPLIAFYHSDRTPTKMPSVKTYTADIKGFLKEFPQVKLLQPWNEANRGYVNEHGPGSYASPNAKQSAAVLPRAARGLPKCTIVGLDVLDSTDVPATIAYINEFKRDVGTQQPAVDLGPAQLLRHQPLPRRRHQGGARRHQRAGLADRDRRHRQARRRLPVQPLAPDARRPSTCSRWPALSHADHAPLHLPVDRRRHGEGALRRRPDQLPRASRGPPTAWCTSTCGTRRRCPYKTASN